MAATAGRPSLHPCHGNLAAVSIDPQHPAALACYRSRGPRLFGAGETVGRLPARAAILACLVASDFASRWASVRSEEHTSEIQSLMRTSYAVYCLKKKTNNR